MNTKSKTVIFFGNEKLATGIPSVEPIIKDALLSAGFAIEQHITGPLSDLKPHTSKVAVLAAYGRIIPQSVLDEFPLGIINVHPSLLPLYRGPTPIEQALLDGASKTGVSIMYLTAGMDEGPIFKQKSIHLKGNESKLDLTTTLQKLGSELLIEVLPSIVTGTVKPRKQPHPDRATYSHKLAKKDGIIDWDKPASQIERDIRAYLGWPGSQTTIGGRDIIITKAQVLALDGIPGSISFDKKQLIIHAKNGALSIERLKPSGKADMDIHQFLAGYSHLLT